MPSYFILGSRTHKIEKTPAQISNLSFTKILFLINRKPTYLTYHSKDKTTRSIHKSATMITINNSSKVQQKMIQQHAVVFRHKLATLIAFATAIYLLCMENVKAFAAPLSDERTLLVVASGAQSLAKRWKTTGTNNVQNVGTSIRHAYSSSALKTFSLRSSAANSAVSSGGSNGNMAFVEPVVAPCRKRNHSKSTTTSLNAFSFAAAPSTPAPEMLDMKTSIHAFGGWYNQMDPVARPPVYEDDLEEYSFSNPADSWPSTYDDVIASGPPTAFRTVNGPGRESSSTSTRGQKRLRPIHTIRKIAGWVRASSPLSRSARGFGSQTFI
mmetsp:Transcript_13259/g.19801  ORF Transcript_13259/g.19801 Transcript_13259/m.19801 type:complete len:326 (+) Transcript_13259:127-1104(+)